jgi:hypothetical protein
MKGKGKSKKFNVFSFVTKMQILCLLAATTTPGTWTAGTGGGWAPGTTGALPTRGGRRSTTIRRGGCTAPSPVADPTTKRSSWAARPPCGPSRSTRVDTEFF